MATEQRAEAPSGAPTPLPLPLLVHDMGQRTAGSQTHYSIATKTRSADAVGKLRDYRCFETPQGWVLALDPASLEAFLWRPQDGDRVALPPAAKDFPSRCKCVLSDRWPRAAEGCAVLVLDLDAPEMLVCRVGGDEWESYTYELTLTLAGGRRREVHMAKRHGVAAVGGKVYYTFSGYAMGVVEFTPELNLTELEVDMVDLPPSMPMSSTYLVESLGELFLVDVIFAGENVHRVDEVAVYRMDFSVPEWRKVGRIGDDRVFLLGGDTIGASNFGASCSASDHGLRGNCIYFVNNIAIEENFLHVFDLESGTEEVHRPFRDKCYVMPMPWPAPRPPFWLLPADD